MALVKANVAFEWSGQQVHVGDVIDDSHVLYLTFPARFDTASSGASVPLSTLVLDQETFRSRLAFDGSTVNSDNTVNGCLDIYSQLATFGQNDLVLLLKGHDDLHVSYAAPNPAFQTLTFAGSPSGNFTLTWNGLTTGNIAYSGTPATLAANIAAALGALAGIDSAATTAPWDDVNLAVTAVGSVVSLKFIGTLVANTHAVTASAITGGTITIANGTPDGKAYFDVPLGEFKASGTILGDGSNGDLTLEIGGASGTFRVKNHSGADLHRITDAGTATFDDGSGTFALVFSGSADGGRISGGGSGNQLIEYATQGTGNSGIIKFRNNSVDNHETFQVDTALPTSGNTALGVEYHNGTSTSYQKITVGAADSGGSGYRLLRVPN